MTSHPPAEFVQAAGAGFRDSVEVLETSRSLDSELAAPAGHSNCPTVLLWAKYVTGPGLILGWRGIWHFLRELL